MNTITADPMQLVRSLSGVIESNAEATEQQGTMPNSVVEAIKKSALFNLLIPTELGGLGAEVTTFAEVVEEMSRQDPSTGWSYMANTCTAGIIAAYISQDAATEIFQNGAVTAGMLGPAGTAKRTDGGYVVSGNYSFGSGSGHADWIASGARLEDDPANPICTVLPRSEVEFTGNWDVYGLQGTGSFDYTVPGRFVDSAFTFPRLNATTLRGQASLYLGNIVLGLVGHIGVAFGTAKRALEEVVAVVDAGKVRPGFPPIREQQLFQHDFVVAEAKYRSTRSHVMECLNEAIDSVRAGDEFTDLQFQRIRQSGTLAVMAAKETVETCYHWSGSQGLRKPSKLGQMLRDMHPQLQHVFVDANSLTGAAPALIDAYRAKGE